MSLSDGHNRVLYNLKYIMYFDTIRERLRCREFFEGVNKILKKGGWWVTNNGGGGDWHLYKLWDICLADCRILHFWQVFTFHKRRYLFIFYDNQVLLVVISQCGPTSCTFQTGLPLPLQFGQEKNISGHSFKRGAYWFVFKIATGRVGTRWWTLL